MNGVYQILIGGNNVNGEYGENVFHYKVTGTSGADDAYTTALALQAAWVTQCLPDLELCCGTDVNLNIMWAKQIDPVTGPTAFNAIDGTGAGSDLTESFAIAADIRFLPGGGGNRAGHWFVFGIPRASFLNGIVNSGYAAILVAFATDILTPLNVLGGTANYGTWTRKTSIFTRSTAYEIVYDKPTALNKRTIPVY